MADQVEEVKLRNDIVSIIGEYVDLKKAGRNFKGLCPFHGEKTPSFMVSQELQIFKCFGCGESGDVFTFLQKHEGLEFYEALKLLADKVGIELKQSTGAYSAKEKLYAVNDLVAKFYHYVLVSHPLGQKALAYLQNNRGLDITTIKAFQLGFSPENSAAFSQYIVSKKHTSIETLEEAGIVYRKGSLLVDRFHGRVIFPLKTHLGSIAGFAGRILPGGREDTAKYINTPDTPVYHKSTMLYGLNETKKEVKHTKELVVVEGELDMLSVWQAGIKHVVALKGTAFTIEQARLIGRFTERVVLALDADVAGDSATRRGIIIAEKEGLEVHVAQITDGKDPDEAVRKNPEAFRKALLSAVPIWDFFISSAIKQYDQTTASGKAHISKLVLPILSEIENHVVQAHYIAQLANRLQVPPDVLFKSLDKKTNSSPTSSIQSNNIPEIKTRRVRLEETVLSYAFTYAPDRVTEELASFFITPRLKALAMHFVETSDPNISSQTFAETLPPELKPAYAELMLMDLRETGFNEETWKDNLSELAEITLKEKMQQISQEIQKHESAGEKLKLKEAQKAFREIGRQLSSLHKESK